MIIHLLIEDTRGKQTFRTLARRITNRTVQTIALKSIMGSARHEG